MHPRVWTGLTVAVVVASQERSESHRLRRQAAGGNLVAFDGKPPEAKRTLRPVARARRKNASRWARDTESLRRTSATMRAGYAQSVRAHPQRCDIDRYATGMIGSVVSVTCAAGVSVGVSAGAGDEVV
jgi:hypothetical protein